jgi:hypothetical protein
VCQDRREAFEGYAPGSHPGVMPRGFIGIVKIFLDECVGWRLAREIVDRNVKRSADGLNGHQE